MGGSSEKILVFSVDEQPSTTQPFYLIYGQVGSAEPPLMLYVKWTSVFTNPAQVFPNGIIAANVPTTSAFPTIPSLNTSISPLSMMTMSTPSTSTQDALLMPTSMLNLAQPTPPNSMDSFTSSTISSQPSSLLQPFELDSVMSMNNNREDLIVNTSTLSSDSPTKTTLQMNELPVVEVVHVHALPPTPPLSKDDDFPVVSSRDEPMDEEIIDVSKPDTPVPISEITDKRTPKVEPLDDVPSGSKPSESLLLKLPFASDAEFTTSTNSSTNKSKRGRKLASSPPPTIAAKILRRAREHDRKEWTMLTQLIEKNPCGDEVIWKAARTMEGDELLQPIYSKGRRRETEASHSELLNKARARRRRETAIRQHLRDHISKCNKCSVLFKDELNVLHELKLSTSVNYDRAKELHERWSVNPLFSFPMEPLDVKPTFLSTENQRKALSLA